MARGQSKKWATKGNPHGYKHGSVGEPRSATSRSITREGPMRGGKKSRSFTTQRTQVGYGNVYGKHDSSGRRVSGRIVSTTTHNRSASLGGIHTFQKTTRTSGHALVTSTTGSAARTNVIRHSHYTANPKKVGAIAGAAAVGYGGYKAYQHRDQIKAKAGQMHSGIHNAFHSTRGKLGAI